MKSFSKWFIAAAVGAIAYFAISVSMNKGKVKIVPKLGQAAACTDNVHCFPEIELLDVDGQFWNRESLLGKIVVVNFWATWCRPCQAEIPELTKFQKDHKDDVVLLGLLRDQPSDSELALFSKNFGLEYPVVRADGDVAVAFGYPEALPTTFIYNRNGKLLDTRRGAIDSAYLERMVSNSL